MVSNAASTNPAERILFFIFPSPEPNLKNYACAPLTANLDPTPDSRHLSSTLKPQEREEACNHQAIARSAPDRRKSHHLPPSPPSLILRDRRLTILQRSPR